MQNFQNRNNELMTKINDLLIQMNNLNLDKNLNDTKNGFIDSVATISNLLSGYFIKDNNGNYPLMSLEKRDELINEYANLISHTTKLKNSSFNNVKALKEVAIYVEEIASKDIKTLIKVDKEMDLPTIFDNSRANEYDITNKEIEVVGGNLNHRLIFTNNEGKKVVFTEDKNYDYEKSKAKLKEDYITKYPEYAKITEKLFTDKFFSKAGDIENTYNNRTEQFDLSFDNICVMCPDIYRAIPDNSKNEFKAMFEKPGFSEFFFNFCNACKKFDLETAFSKNYLNLIKDEVASDRNSGMSVVAELLGCGNLLVHSEPAYIIRDGKKIRGTVMNFAEGKNFSSLKIDDKVFEADYSDMYTSECKKQLADLQIIDFICGNIDRHYFNMFYKIDENNKCIGICGIDNDGSFGLPKLDEIKNGSGNMLGYKNLGIMSETMAEKLKLITPEMMELSLRGLKMSNEAIKASLERFNIVRDMALDVNRNKVYDGKKFLKNLDNCSKDNCTINIIKDDQWTDISFLDLASSAEIHDKNSSSNNLYNTAMQGRFYAKQNAEKFKNEYEKNLIAKFEVNNCVKTSLKDFDNQSKLLKSGIWFLRGSSAQYNKIKDNIKLIKDSIKKIPNNPSNEDLTEFKNKINEAINDSQNYLNRKSEEQKTKTFGTYTKIRIRIMEKYNKFLKDKIKQIDKSMENVEKTNNDIENKKAYINNYKISKNSNFINKVKTDTIEVVKNEPVDNIKKENQQLNISIEESKSKSK